MTEQTKKRMGRPPKKKGKNPVGRPKGEAGIMKQYRERMLNSPQSRAVIQSIFDADLDDNHTNLAAAWKIVIDRIAPLAGFEKEAGSSPRAAIQVNISGVPGVEVSAGDVIEGEVVE